MNFINNYDVGNMTKMAVVSIFSKDSLKLFFPRTSWQISTEHHSLFK